MTRWRVTTGSGTRRPRRPGAAASGRLAGVLVLTALAAGCGIRTTSVPVDAGPAPSRKPCEVSGKDVITQARPGVPVRIYLACSSGLASVERAAQIQQGKGPDDRVRIAQGLLDELQAQPSADEREAGFATAVRGPLVISASRDGDPVGTLRLSRQPEDLPATALAQIVCTFAESEATDGQVVLGGPGDYPPHVYGCTPATKAKPDGPVPTLGPVPASSGSASPSGS
ncbi:hypothetical protein [Streptomyces sp. 35G-GA-8]|uniref:hypothetical protein n=1 Tax=Streptomyces sp. 35G-GA-8 TaxID=2939434 RepID=UPI00201F38EF|nr:hypothetical protein [Streptomyces sp. 35G-GA-8]MCL7376144.1 hypothetical protein [Streptomyces sp. 35G-GA-8]